MDATSLDKQKKGNLYVYKLSPKTPEHNHYNNQPPVTKRMIPSSIWSGLRKSKSKSKPKQGKEEEIKKDDRNIASVKDDSKKIVDGNGKGNLSGTAKILMTLANAKVVEGRKSVSYVEEENKRECLTLKHSNSMKEGRIEGGRRSVSHVENSVAYVGKFVEKPRKSTGAKIENNVASAMALCQVKVLVTDMPGFMQVHAFQSARRTFDSLEKFSAKHLAYNLKKEFDKVYGPAWHCIVGSSFGSFVTHATGCFLYFSMEKLCILLFRTKVPKAIQQ